MHPLFINPQSGIGSDYWCKRLCPLRGPFTPYGYIDHSGIQATRAKAKAKAHKEKKTTPPNQT